MSHAASAPLAPPSFSPAASAADGHCLNCHQELTGPYCHHCGQAASVPARITGHHLLHELPHTIWHLDHGIIYTVREMLLRPGQSIRRYLAGERRPFYPPLSLLLLLGTVSAFFLTMLHVTPFSTQTTGIATKLQWAQEHATHVFQKYHAWLSVLFVPISATVATPLLRRSTGYGWAEQAVAATLLSGAFATVSLLFIPAMAHWSGTPDFGKVVTVMVLTRFAYKAWGYAQLQAISAAPPPLVGRWVRGLLVAAGEYAGSILVFGTLLLVLILLHH